MPVSEEYDCRLPAAGACCGRWFCGGHLERHRAAEQRLAERLAAARTRPLPTLDEAVALLRERGLLPDGFRPIPGGPEAPDGGVFCGTCQGMRWLRFDEPGPQNGWHSDIRRCPHCANRDVAERRNRLARMAGLATEQRTKTFASFKPHRLSLEAVSAVSRWAQEPKGWLVLYGVPGSGKTHLALAAANLLVNREQPFRWWYAADLMIEVKRLMQEELHWPLLAELKRTPVLFLDDLGSARPTDFALSDFLEPLFNARYEQRLPTFVTCIGDPEEIKRSFSESIGRRMQDPTVCRVVHNAAPQWGLEPTGGE